MSNIEHPMSNIQSAKTWTLDNDVLGPPLRYGNISLKKSFIASQERISANLL
jgi:hypothetical protein